MLMFPWFLSVLSVIYTTVISGQFGLGPVERDTILMLAIKDLCSTEHPELWQKFKVKGNWKNYGGP